MLEEIEIKLKTISRFLKKFITRDKVIETVMGIRLTNTPRCKWRKVSMFTQAA